MCHPCCRCPFSAAANQLTRQQSHADTDSTTSANATPPRRCARYSQAGGYYIICNSGVASDIADKCDLSSSSLAFSGDDVIALAKVSCQALSINRLPFSAHTLSHVDWYQIAEDDSWLHSPRALPTWHVQGSESDYDLLDTIGDAFSSTDPGSSWTVCGDGGGTVDSTLIRTECSGNSGLLY